MIECPAGANERGGVSILDRVVPQRLADASGPQWGNKASRHWPAPSSFVMKGGRDIILIFLSIALEGEKIPIAAIVLAGEIPAWPRPRLIDGAAARCGVEELADAAKMLVFLAPHDAFVAV